MTVEGGARRPASHAVDMTLAFLAIGLALLTTFVVTVPNAAPAVVNDRLDIAIVTAAMLVSGAVAGLDYARGRVAYDPAALLRASAFAVLALLNGLTLAIGIVGVDDMLGAALENPGQLPVIGGVVARGVASVLLVFGGWFAISRGVPALRAPLVLIGPAAVVLGLLLAAAVLRDSLPALVPLPLLRDVAEAPTEILAVGSAPLLLVLQTLIGAAFSAAAFLAYRAFGRSGRSADALLAAGFLVAAFSQVHSAIHPGGYSGLVTVADFLRLLFYAILLVGVVVESRDDLADLRAATMEVRRLAEAHFAAVALEERASLAREIHDGLAQDLWYAKLKQSRLAQIGQFTGESEQLSDEVGTAIDNALAEARNAVAAMRQGAESRPLLELLTRLVDDFADRFAVRAELHAEGPPPELGPRADAEVLRIVQEALTNVRKHADATVVRVNVATDGDLRLTIADNGRGFRRETLASGFGLESMRQRAAVIGAELQIESEPQNGTRVELVMRNTGRRGAVER